MSSIRTTKIQFGDGLSVIDEGSGVVRVDGGGGAALEWEDTGTGASGGAVLTVQDEGTALPVRATMNFIGAGVTASDDSANSRTNVTIPGAAAGGFTDPLWSALGFKALTGSPREFGCNVGLVSGAIQASAVWIKAGSVLTRIGLYMVSGGFGVTTCKVGVYDSGSALLASSANTVALPQGTGWRLATLASAWTCPTDGVYYLAYIAVGSDLGTYFSNASPTAQGWAALSSSPATGSPWITWQQSGQTDLTNPATPAAFADKTPLIYAI